MAKKLFDICCGNPPYQNIPTGSSNTATPVYHDFMDAVYEVSDKTLLITPARFLFNAGYTPREWNEKMLNDEHFKVLSYMPDASKVFSGVDIKGGVAITYRDSDKAFGAIHIFTQYSEMNSILHKVMLNPDFAEMSKLIVSSFAYHYTKCFYEENPTFIGRASSGHDYDVQSNTFSVFPEAYTDVAPDKTGDYIRMLGRLGSKREWKYIKRKYITTVSNLDSYKVFLPKATGKGEFGEVLPEAIVGEIGDAATVTFIGIGNFKTREEAQNCVRYTQTKIARALLNVLKVTQDNTPGKWKYVPIQDFSASSDIDWSRPVHEIDLQLYRKYKLSKEEIDFIEKNVKEMV